MLESHVQVMSRFSIGGGGHGVEGGEGGGPSSSKEDLRGVMRKKRKKKGILGPEWGEEESRGSEEKDEEKSKWVSGQVTKKKGSNVHDIDTLSYSPLQLGGTSSFCPFRKSFLD